MIPSHRGSWSPTSLFFVVVIVFIGLCLLAAFVVLLVMGRFRHTPPATDDIEAGEAGEDATAEALAPGPAGETVAALENNTVAEASAPPKRETGLWQALAAIGIGLLSPILFNLLENMYGSSVPFHWDTAIQILLLAAQIVFTAQLYRRQRKFR